MTQPRDITDAMDELSKARFLVELIDLTCDKEPTLDQMAISAGCQAVIEKIRSVEATLGGLNQPS